MREKIHHLSRSTLVRYLCIGGLSYAVELTSIYLLIYLFSLTPVEASAIAFWIGLVISFFAQKIFAFSNTNFSLSHLSKQTVQYGLLVIFNYIFTLLFIYILRDYEVGITRTIALAITTFWNYLIYKSLIFKK